MYFYHHHSNEQADKYIHASHSRDIKKDIYILWFHEDESMMDQDESMEDLLRGVKTF